MGGILWVTTGIVQRDKAAQEEEISYGRNAISYQYVNWYDRIVKRMGINRCGYRRMGFHFHRDNLKLQRQVKVHLHDNDQGQAIDKCPEQI